MSELPVFPPHVRYALTVPQSVLFADISLRGSRREAMRTVFGSDFALDFVVIDDGAMSWDFRGEGALVERLLGTAHPETALRRFISGMARTARAVDKTSWLLGLPGCRRRGRLEDVLKDLRDYWTVYELHMTSLFTFWNIEEFLMDALSSRLRDAGRDDEIRSGLTRFLQPSEVNYFALERRHLTRVAGRFADADNDLEGALRSHVAAFGFLLAPFNLGGPPSIATVADRVAEGGRDEPGALVWSQPDALTELPDPARELGLLAQEFTFWKTERLDVLALADARVGSLYGEAAALLSLDISEVFTLTRDELEESLQRGAAVVDAEVRETRAAGFCLLLEDGVISFRDPTGARGVKGVTAKKLIDGRLEGFAASAGVAKGRVRVLLDLADIDRLEPGDVLVTTMTRPEMGAALDRAAAFVTDEGGRMAHAAIIAREMRKPCVTATEIATQVLCDGDVVEVDGGAGTVTVVARA